MPRQMTVTQVKANLFLLIRDVASGEDIEITLRGKTVARLTAASGPKAPKGFLKGVAHTNAPDKDLFSTSPEWNAQ